MNVALRKRWTTDEFLAWVVNQEERYEFDGVGPVAVTGRSVIHGLIMRNLFRALEARLTVADAVLLGPDVGIRTVGDAVRYPDALVTFAPLEMDAPTVPDAAVVFEILSASSSRTDRIVKVREYASVPAIREYVIIESASIGLTVLSRGDGAAGWTVSTLTDAGEILELDAIKVSLPVSALYERVRFDPVEPGRPVIANR